MNRTLGVLVMAGGAAVLATGSAWAQSQYPMVDMVATRVIEKYQSSSCAELAARHGQPPSRGEERVVQVLREDPGARQAFLNRVAGPIANKLFECRLIP